MEFHHDLTIKNMVIAAWKMALEQEFLRISLLGPVWSPFNRFEDVHGGLRNVMGVEKYVYRYNVYG